MKQIEVDALKEKLDKIPARSIENADGRAYVLIRLSTVFEIIKQIPPAQPERKKGHWIAPKYYPTQFTYTCSKCGYKQSFNGKFKFCPNCGVDMRGKQE